MENLTAGIAGVFLGVLIILCAVFLIEKIKHRRKNAVSKSEPTRTEVHISDFNNKWNKRAMELASQELKKKQQLPPP